ncbi:unnamed protein product, partial [Brassica rapa subsp. trilocularis]
INGTRFVLLIVLLLQAHSSLKLIFRFFRRFRRIASHESLVDKVP